MTGVAMRCRKPRSGCDWGNAKLVHSDRKVIKLFREEPWKCLQKLLCALARGIRVDGREYGLVFRRMISNLKSS